MLSLDISPTEKSILVKKNEKRFYHSSNDGNQNFNFDRNSMEQFRTAITYSIEKITSETIFIKTESQRDQYWYDEDRTFYWKILPETVKIGEYETQKANYFLEVENGLLGLLRSSFYRLLLL